MYYSKTTAREWGGRRERALLLNGRKVRKEVQGIDQVTYLIVLLGGEAVHLIRRTTFAE